MFTYSFNKHYSYLSICQWDSTLVKVKMDAGCILGMASSSARNPIQRPATVREPLERAVHPTNVLERELLAIPGER